MYPSVLLLLALQVLTSASLHDIDNSIEQRNDATGSPGKSANRSMLTDQPLLSVTKFRQRRPVHSSSFKTTIDTNLEWITFKRSIINTAVSIYNRNFDRTDYVCKYKCDTGFYTPKEGPYCFFARKNRFHRVYPFELLVNRDNFEILEWKDNSSGKVPKNSVSTCPGEQIYVGMNKYGLGNVSTKEKAFYLPWKGKVYTYTSYKVLTTNENIVSQQIDDVRYNIDNAKILQYPPEAMRQTTISNYECQPVVKTSSISKTSEVEHRWDTTSSVTVTVNTSITIGIPTVFKKEIHISTEVSFAFTQGTTMTESFTDTVSVEVTVPPNQSCVINMLRYKYKVDIPFTGRLRRTYGNGNIRITSITGKYNGIQVGEVRAVVNRCEPLGGSKPCP
ncbi:natterin-3-like [Oreochromis niloticus]|uniref:natterin-3-like n=1 Tax=Oreochromis niloticus TaxID=8128 RepID=UPI000DF44D06|nr:natterin-3-like [Oreochromis niloticus]